MGLFCLVHGTTQSPAGWNLLVREMEELGQQTLCVDLPVNEPRAGASRYSQVIAAALQGKGPAIVVGHSGSGLFLPLVPQYHPVARLVFLAAVIPELGRSLFEQFRAAPEMFCPDWPGKDPTKDEELAKRFLFHDCSQEILPWALSTRRLMNPQKALMETCPLERWPEVASSYILCREDRTLNPAWWRRTAAERLGRPAIEVFGGHCPHVSRPRELAEVLVSLITREPF